MESIYGKLKNKGISEGEGGWCSAFAVCNPTKYNKWLVLAINF